MKTLLDLLARVLRWLLALVRRPAPARVPGPVHAGPMRWPLVARALWVEAMRRPGVQDMSDLEVVTLYARFAVPKESDAPQLVRAWQALDQGERAAAVRRMRGMLRRVVRPGIAGLRDA